MAWYPYSYKTAFNPISRELAPAGASGQIFAVGDTDFLTPLQPYDLSGLPVDLEVQGEVGYVPSFQVENHASVIWKSGSYVFEFTTTMPLPGPTGASIKSGTDNGDGTMTFQLTDGTTVGPIEIPEGPEGPRGPAGYNATGAVEDQETLSSYVDKVAGPNAFSDSLDEAYGVMVNVQRYGAVGDGRLEDRDAILAAAADAAGGVLLFPSGRYEVGDGLPLAGFSCSIIGQGADINGAIGTTIVASSQAGPVLDFTDFAWPQGYRSAIKFDGFAVEGSGIADATQANSGIKITGVQGGNNGGAGAAVWGEIVVSKTGGPCIDAARIYLHKFENVRLIQPIGAQVNNVPHFFGGNASGNDMHLDLYSPNEVGAAGGALVLTDDGGHASTKNLMNIRAENLHPPTDGTILHLEANENFVELRHFDVTKESGATGTSMIRLLPPPGAQDHGGTEIRGQIPGNNGAAAAVDYGVDVGQSKNSIVGVKGFDGDNVRIRTGVTYSYVELRGARAGGTAPGVIDESQDGTNTIFDYMRYPGVGVAETAHKVVDTARSNTTVPTSDPVLRLEVDANAAYAVEAVMMYYATDTANLKAGISVPAGGNLTFAADAPNPGASSASNTTLTRAISAGGNLVLGGVNDNIMGRYIGTLVTGSTPGTVAVRWAQNNAEASDTIMRAGSTLRVSRIA